MEGRAAPGHGTAGGKDDGDIEPRNHLNETPADSEAGEEMRERGAHDARAPHRHRLAARGVPAHAQGRRNGRRRDRRADSTRATGGESPVAARPREVGQYRAPPVRRVHIPKGDGQSTRPIGIPTFEDKVLQRAVRDGAGGRLRAGVSATARTASGPALGASGAAKLLRKQTMEMGGGWVLEVDIKKFFDTLDHRHLQEILRRGVRDGVLLRLIGKWLNAGVHGGRGAVSRPRPARRKGESSRRCWRTSTCTRCSTSGLRRR